MPIDPYAGADSAAFGAAALDLTPRGPAWPRDSDSNHYQFWQGLGDIAASMFQGRQAAWTEQESDPAQAVDTLARWELDYGLPDPCLGPDPDQSIAQRQAAVLARMTDPGGLSAAYLIARAAQLGFVITVTITRPFYDCLSSCVAGLYTIAWRPYFVVHAPETTVSQMTCLDDCVAPLRWWGNAALECLINRIKPAHKVAIFAYGD